MKLSTKLHNPLKHFQFGWSYNYQEHSAYTAPDFGSELEEVNIRVWMFEINLGFITVFTGDMITLDDKPQLKSIKGGKQ